VERRRDRAPRSHERVLPAQRGPPGCRGARDRRGAGPAARSPLGIPPAASRSVPATSRASTSATTATAAVGRSVAKAVQPAGSVGKARLRARAPRDGTSATRRDATRSVSSWIPRLGDRGPRRLELMTTPEPFHSSSRAAASRSVPATSRASTSATTATAAVGRSRCARSPRSRSSGSKPSRHPASSTAISFRRWPPHPPHPTTLAEQAGLVRGCEERDLGVVPQLQPRGGVEVGPGHQPGVDVGDDSNRRRRDATRSVSSWIPRLGDRGPRRLELMTTPEPLAFPRRGARALSCARASGQRRGRSRSPRLGLKWRAT
jgi:hypothetical protein